MISLRRFALLAGLTASLLASSCSRSSDSGSGGSSGNGLLYIQSCSLGCSNGTGGQQVSCSIINTPQNQEVSILFTEAVDLFSVNSSSFRIVDIQNGSSPTGEFSVDAIDPRRLIFRPSLGFDNNGNPQFGLKPNRSYQITVPGEAQGDPPPYIQSTTGRPNQSRLQCTIQTSLPVVDPVPGNPSVEVYADKLLGTDGQGNPVLARNQQVNTPDLLTDVWSGTRIKIRFRDIMNLASVVNPQTGTAPFIRIELDQDGDLATNDRQPIGGEYVPPSPAADVGFATNPALQTFVDLSNLETYLVFQPDLPLPSAGGNPTPRKVTVTVPTSVVDLVGNPVTLATGGGLYGMEPEVITFDPIVIPEGGEDFAFNAPNPSSNEDAKRSSGEWGAGRLVKGFGGGSGRLGALNVGSGETLVLNTDSQDFPLPQRAADLIGNADGNPVDSLGGFPDALTVTDGVFEFTSLTVQAGGSLRFVGVQPARVYVRGPVNVSAGGVINMSGVSPLAHDGLVAKPEQEYLDAVAGGATPVINAAGGGDGGFGGDRFDASGTGLPALTIGIPESDAIENPGADENGRNGQGVGRSTVNSLGRGRGGIQYPLVFPNSTNTTSPHDLGFNVIPLPDKNNDTRCTSLNVGAVGSGGAYATDGTSGNATYPTATAEYPAGQSNLGPVTQPGDSSQLSLAPPNQTNTGYIIRKLEWFINGINYPAYLRGGAGGGGGGNHPFRTLASGFNNTSTTPCISNFSAFWEWHDHSGAQGGYGGGALLLVSGTQVRIDGRIDLRGGNGGSGLTGVPGDFFQYAMPGGGGSGGALKLQAPNIVLANVADRILLEGGMGGTSPFSGSVGGSGGTGLIRIEDTEGILGHADYAPWISPFDGTNDPLSLDFLSVASGGWVLPRRRPEGVTGSVSCWIRPDGNFVALNFREDVPASTDPDDMGWNMTVLYQPTGAPSEIEVPFRGLNGNSPFAVSWEDNFGKDLGPDGPNGAAAPIVVRFQGARVNRPLDDNHSETDGDLYNDPCDLALSGADTPVIAGSVTPWVDHPALLNEWADTFGKPEPNMVRYVILFDGTLETDTGDTPGLVLYQSVKGVTGLLIRADPD